MLWIMSAASLILAILSHRWPSLAWCTCIAAIVTGIFALFAGANLRVLAAGAVTLSVVILWRGRHV